jgi:hypothetical protein
VFDDLSRVETWHVKARKRRPLKSSITGKLTQRLGKVRQSNGQTHVGFAWYQREQWDRLRELAADAHGLEEQYDAWLASAERTLAMVRSQGLKVERVVVDVEEIAAWCARAGRRFDGKARSEYVAELMRNRASQT